MPDTRSQNLSYRTRRWMYAPILAALAVGAVTSGVSIGSADTSSEADSTRQVSWRVHNFTDQTLTAGDFHRDRGANVGSALAFGGTTPWAALKPGEVTADAFQAGGAPFNKTRTWGRVCYLGQIWNMPRVAGPLGRPDGDLNDLYVFAMQTKGGKKLMVTYEGGGDDVDMNAYGESC